MTGGRDSGTTVYDSGTVTAVIAGQEISVSYGQGSTVQTIAQALISGINAAGTLVTASPGSAGTINLTANSPGPDGNNISVSAGVASMNPGQFAPPSFSATASSMSGGSD